MKSYTILFCIFSQKIPWKSSGDTDRKYGYAVVAGIERAPFKVGRRMSKAKIAKRSTVKPFVKVINYNHLLPT
eukprot:Pgem_evm1s13532